MSNILRKIGKFVIDDKIRFSYLTELGLTRWMSDEEFLKKEFYLAMGKPLNLENPQTFNEKLQWLKIHNRKPEYTTMVDKYAAKQYVADKIGSQYIIPTLGVWDHFDDIDFGTLPDQFVLKCTHDSGGLVICKDKAKLDKKAAKKMIEHCLRRKYYYVHREWPYKDVKPRIIAEKYMTNDANEDMRNYKLMCYDGKVKATFVCSNRFSKDGLKVTFYDTDWKRMPFERHYPARKTEVAKPKTYDEMVTLAEQLAQNIPFIRADFYEICGKTYFGELTFFPECGFDEFSPEEWDKTLGDWIELPETSGKGYLICGQGYLLWIHDKEMLSKTDNEGLTDYKFYCFSGKPEYLYVSDHMDQHDKAHISFADMDYQQAPFGRTDYKSFNELPPVPENFEKMKLLAAQLSKNVPYLRVDFYEINHRVFFGELTFSPCSGLMPFDPEKWDEKLGKLLKLPENFEGGGGHLILNKGYLVLVHCTKTTDEKQLEELSDYKFYCFDGKMKFVMINSERNSLGRTRADYFDRNFNWLDFKWGYEHAPTRPQKPEKFEEMIEIAEKLAYGIPHVRVDLYESEGQIYFGELTFFDGSGMDKIEPIEWDYRIGEMLKIPISLDK